jgi:hypothetical protein
MIIEIVWLYSFYIYVVPDDAFADHAADGATGSGESVVKAHLCRTDVRISKMFLPKKFAKILAFFAKTTDSFYKN